MNTPTSTENAVSQWLFDLAQIIQHNYETVQRRIDERPFEDMPEEPQSIESIQSALHLYQVFTPIWLELAKAGTRRREDLDRWNANQLAQRETEKADVEKRFMDEFWEAIESKSALPARDSDLQSLVEQQLAVYNLESTFANRALIIANVLKWIFLFQQIHDERIIKAEDLYRDVEIRREIIKEMLQRSRR